MTASLVSSLLYVSCLSHLKYTEFMWVLLWLSRSFCCVIKLNTPKWDILAVQVQPFKNEKTCGQHVATTNDLVQLRFINRPVSSASETSSGQLVMLHPENRLDSEAKTKKPVPGNQTVARVKIKIMAVEKSTPPPTTKKKNSCRGLDLEKKIPITCLMVPP